MNIASTPQVSLTRRLPSVGVGWVHQGPQNHCGPKAKVVRLPDERELNFQATTGDGTHHIHKVALVRVLLVNTTGLQRSLLKIRAPRVFSKANANQLVATLDKTLTAFRDIR